MGKGYLFYAIMVLFSLELVANKISIEIKSSKVSIAVCIFNFFVDEIILFLMGA